MGVICFVLASPPTTGAMCCIFGALWALLSFVWSFIDPGTWVKTANRRWFHWFRAFTGVSGHFCLTPHGGNMLRACFSAHYWVHVLHIWGSLGVIVVFMVMYRPFDLGQNGKSSLRGPPGRLHHPKGLPTLRPGGRAPARSPGRLHHPQGLH
jgi:hypothetical protein